MRYVSGAVRNYGEVIERDYGETHWCVAVEPTADVSTVRTDAGMTISVADTRPIG